VSTVRFPVDEDEDAWYLQERYREGSEGSLARTIFYRLKPVIPRGVQIRMRRALAQRIRRREGGFPSWPYEDVLLRRRADALREQLAASGADRLPVVAPWPDGKRFAYVLTHDVESRDGLDRVDELLAVEARHGIVSSWNLCAEWYPIHREDLDRIRAAGCEIGVHGLRHDDRLFRDRAGFDEALPEIRRHMDEFGAVGFRAPALHRNADWMHELPCRYDSSFPHVDPFQPIPGGCCSIHPFFFGDVVELPVTLDQDFTVFDILQEPTIDLWLDKSRWIAGHGGLVNVIVHPDYMTPGRLDRYEELLVCLQSLDGGWHALPRDVADWWRLRANLAVSEDANGDAMVTGPGAERARIVHARPGDGAVQLDE
jgi:peptidoglycan/xylan/chitin deacetylase (PgdA/CDA1 family)